MHIKSRLIVLFPAKIIFKCCKKNIRKWQLYFIPSSNNINIMKMLGRFGSQRNNPNDFKFRDKKYHDKRQLFPI